MRLYFETDTAKVIVRTGFHVHDEEDWYRDGQRIRGVTVSERPVPAGRGVAVDLPLAVIREYEVDPDSSFRQFVVPLSTLAAYLAVAVD
jgi:hypothetical protein